MSQSLPPKCEGSTKAADLPKSLAEAIEKVRKSPEDMEAWADLDESCREHDRPDEAAALYTEVLAAELSAEVLEQVGRAGERAVVVVRRGDHDQDPLLEGDGPAKAVQIPEIRGDRK